jgi:hypothetical protein
VHHPKQETNRDDTKWKAEREKQRKEQAIADTTGIRVLKAIGDAVPVRLLKRDLLFVLMQTFPLLNEWQFQTLARQHGIRKDRETDMLSLACRDQRSPSIGAQQRHNRTSGRGGSLQGGYGRDCPQGEAGVCGQRKIQKRAEAQVITHRQESQGSLNHFGEPRGSPFI